jgi:hypothetical protein
LRQIHLSIDGSKLGPCGIRNDVVAALKRTEGRAKIYHLRLDRAVKQALFHSRKTGILELEVNVSPNRPSASHAGTCLQRCVRRKANHAFVEKQ